MVFYCNPSEGVKKSYDRDDVSGDGVVSSGTLGILRESFGKQADSTGTALLKYDGSNSN